MYKGAVVFFLCLSLLIAGCLPAPPPPQATPGFTVQGAVVSGMDAATVTLRAYGPEVTVALTSPVVADFGVILTNVRAGEVAVSGMTPIAREVVSPTAVKFLFRLPAGQTVSARFSVPAADRFAFAVIGDNRDGPEVYSRLIGRLNAAKPALVVNGGDLVPDGKAVEYDAFLRASAELTVPYFTVVGNHDIHGDGRSLYNKLLAPNYYDFVWGNVHFIMLDDADGGMDEAQLAWLEGKLRQRAARHVFLFLHRPPFDPRPGGRHAVTSAALGERLVNLAAEYKVTVVFSSHIHAYVASERRGVPYYITGGAGAPLYEKREAGGYNHYLWVEVAGGNVKVTPVAID